MFLIIDLAIIEESQKKFINQAYDIWTETYEPILSEAGEKISADYFYRCRLITILTAGDQVQAFMLHNFYDLSLAGVRDLSYFNPARHLIENGAIKESSKIFSCEWVTVHPDLRARFSKVQLGDVMMGLAFKAMQGSHCNSAMGFSRTDNKADRMAEKFGFEKLDLIKRHDKECGVMFLEVDSLKDHPYSKTQETINAFYEDKMNFSSIINNLPVRTAS